MIIGLVVSVVPVASPVQPVNTYCVACVPKMVDADNVAVAEVPELYHPDPLVRPYIDETVR